VKVEDASVHHFIPTSRGGNKAGIFNQTGAHQSCNSRKSDTAPTSIEWFRYIRSTHRTLTVELDTIDLRAAYPELNGTP
jgi:5-methylcytosine-specific restriction endonuclease McrA